MSSLLVGSAGLSPADFLALFGHFAVLSLLAVGGAIATAPDMQRYVVGQHDWISDAQFTDSVALAQAAPGPNVLFVAVVGFNVGGLAGVLATLAGSLLPSTTLALAATRWGAQHAASRAVQAFKTGLAPLSIGLLVATGWVLAEPAARLDLPILALVPATMALMLGTRASPLWAIALGAVVGAWVGR